MSTERPSASPESSPARPAAPPSERPGRGRPAQPPERIVLPGLTLRRPVEDDLPALVTALNESFEHLRPWMPWATGPQTLEQERAWLAATRRAWDEGTEYVYLLETSDGGRAGGKGAGGKGAGGKGAGGKGADGSAVGGGIAGTVGLHDRLGPDALEIGYWVHVAHTGRGLATRAAGALTEVALGLPGVERVEIRCDVANKRSAAVPPRLGYWLLGIEDGVPQAPAEQGRSMRWVMTREAWSRRNADLA
ncbi:N-acetyltransferase [Actinomadura logoneensis]|uniref:N-acetyltransferase n=1 Tax=Actinomadura logoneensis TaxID=2293572 RepID=A0A372JSZ5_9ACTN|nr:GNAT family N-acetyltransferase [Actinomadura logoneensis]RFU42468.1 N-acetyltransferase [Actinomadura logoneensis]